MNRRDFIKTSGIVLPLGVSALSFGGLYDTTLFIEDNPAKRFSRYCGFNLTEKISGVGPRLKFNEADFEILSEWGMNFARIPLSYRNWASHQDWYTFNYDVMEDIDEVIKFGMQYHVHINLSFYRTPGYCINGRHFEPMDLFNDSPDRMQKALDATIFHWKYFAKRYKGISSEKLSFNLINEPPGNVEQRYEEIIRAVVNGIREEDPERLIVVDGKNIARKPLLEIADLNVIHSTRGYHPIALTYFGNEKISDSERETLKSPTWPLKADNGTVWDKSELKKKLIEPWQPLIDNGVTIHVGEWGCFNHTPHPIMLAWAKDILSIWKEAGWGHALWNLRGPFGVLDSDRKDAAYEDYKGHKLDRKFLELLKEFI